MIVNCDLAATYDGEIIVQEGFLRATCGNKTGACRGLGGTKTNHGLTLAFVRGMVINIR